MSAPLNNPPRCSHGIWDRKVSTSATKYNSVYFRCPGKVDRCKRIVWESELESIPLSQPINDDSNGKYAPLPSPSLSSLLPTIHTNQTTMLPTPPLAPSPSQPRRALAPPTPTKRTPRQQRERLAMIEAALHHAEDDMLRTQSSTSSAPSTQSQAIATSPDDNEMDDVLPGPPPAISSRKASTSKIVPSSSASRFSPYSFDPSSTPPSKGKIVTIKSEKSKPRQTQDIDTSPDDDEYLSSQPYGNTQSQRAIYDYLAPTQLSSQRQTDDQVDTTDLHIASIVSATRHVAQAGPLIEKLVQELKASELNVAAKDERIEQLETELNALRVAYGLQ